MPHRWGNTELLRVVDILVACQAAINRLPQQRQQAVLLVLAKSRILQALCTTSVNKPRRMAQFCATVFFVSTRPARF